MNFNFYIFGTPKGRYNQYPDDYIASTLSHLQENTEGARLVIQRETNLIHYVYTERMDESNVIGFCVVFNNVRILKPKRLIHFFRSIIEKNLIESGNIIKFNNKGKLQYAISSFSECAKENDKIRELVNNELESNSKEYGFEPLKTAYNGTKSIDIIDFSAFDSQIVQLSDKHNIVIVNHKVGIEHGYIPQVISSLREQNLKANEEIRYLQEENAALDKKKKQYRYVVLLSLLIVGCLVGLYLFYNEVNDKAARIAYLENTVTERNATIADRDSTIVGLQTSISDLHSDLETIASYTASTGATLRNNDNHDSGWILWLNAKRKVRMESFYIKGQSSGTVDIGLFDTNDNLIASYEASAASGEFRKVNVGSEWTLDRGTYYMKIRSGVSLQYHGSSDREYGQFSGGALEVTGASSYGDRNDLSKRTNHGYYQYFYNIRYHIVMN
jgi:hypothetical protein